MDNHKPEIELLKLFDALINTITKLKKIRDDEIPFSLIYELLNMTSNSRSKTFSESSDWLDPELADSLMEQGLIQEIIHIPEGNRKFALTLRGIARCASIRYGKTLGEQFVGFLERTDRRYNTTIQNKLLWDEKLASLSMILLASTSPSAAIRLNIEANKNMLTKVFQETLVCLKTHRVLNKDEKLKSGSRGEAVSSYLMSRLNALPPKINHYYKHIGRGSEYFLDIQLNDDIDAKRLLFLLKKIFESYDSTCNYTEVYKDLTRLSQFYYPRFLSRSVNPNVVLSILKKLKEFMERDVLTLPLAHQPARTVDPALTDRN